MLSHPPKERLSIFLAALLLTVVLQWNSNAFIAEWSDSSDEAAHYVTGLLVRDYITQGLPEMPMSFAARYYEHYPYVGFGHFPPVFYLLQAAWTLGFGISKTSLLVLMAAISGALLTTFYVVARRYFSRWLCVVLLVFLATLPAMQLQSRMLIADGLVALLAFWSLLVFERYLNSGRNRDALAFGLMAATTILTKGTGIALAPVPAIMAVIRPQKNLLKSGGFWLPALLVVLVCAPWFLLVPDALHDRVARYGGIHFLPYRFGESFRYLWDQLHIAGSLLALAGVIVVFFQRKVSGSPGNLFWTLGAAFFISCLGFRMTIGAWEPRHLLMILPILMLFAGAGLAAFIEISGRARPAALAVLAIAVGATCFFNIQRVRPKYHIGLDRIAADLVSDPRTGNSRLLIVSNTVGEGVFVGEIAMREKRPGHIVERGSKLLATNNFMGSQYELNFSGPEGVMRFLETTPERIIILDHPRNPPPHVELIRATVDAYPERWKTLTSYQRPGSAGAPASRIEVLALTH